MDSPQKFLLHDHPKTFLLPPRIIFPNESNTLYLLMKSTTHARLWLDCWQASMSGDVIALVFLRSRHAFVEAFDYDRLSITSIFVSKVALRVWFCSIQNISITQFDPHNHTHHNFFFPCPFLVLRYRAGRRLAGTAGLVWEGRWPKGGKSSSRMTFAPHVMGPYPLHSWNFYTRADVK